MGPITLFDKSFLQSLSLDESVWFDHFFITNVCPLFYIETLADLGKPDSDKRSAVETVRMIADKFPDTSSGPCTLHTELVLQSLLGKNVPMTGQVPLATARVVQFEGTLNAISEDSPVAAAFYRWQDEEFEAIEHEIASKWREDLARLNLEAQPELLRYWTPFQARCATLQEASDLAKAFATATDIPLLRLEICMTLLQVPKDREKTIRARWVQLGYPSLAQFAPYASFVLSIIIFFRLSIGASLISPNRASNLTDVAYLFYLPFCMIFVSSDKLHSRIAPLFLRQNQEYVWGPELKASLTELNLYYSLFDEKEKQKGIYKLAPEPPQHLPTLVSDLWDRHIPKWREPQAPEEEGAAKARTDAIRKKVELMEQASPVAPASEKGQYPKIESVTIKRKVRQRKGEWYRIPKNVKD